MAVIAKTVLDTVNNILVSDFGLERVEESFVFNKYSIVETGAEALTSCRYLYSFEINILLSSLSETDYLVFGSDSVTAKLLQAGYSVSWNREEREEPETGYLIRFECKTFL